MNQNYDIKQGSKRLQGLKPSMIRKVMTKTSELLAQGKPVIRFSVGEPNFDTPSDIKEATIRALTNNHTHYSSNLGYLPLREKITKALLEETGVDYDPNTEIMITHGAAEALSNAIVATVDRDDEVIIAEPAYVVYNSLTGQCEGKEVCINLDPANGFNLDLDALRAAITDKTKMLIINNPANPTGAVLSEECLAEIARLAVEHNFIVLSDEIYSRLVYDDVKFRSMASFPGMKERTIIVNGFSKTYAMTGWRLGYIACDKTLMPTVMKAHQYATSCCPTFIQIGAAEGMDTERTKKEVEDMIAAFDRRRKLLMSLLDECEGLSYVRPQGAFYVMVNVKGLGITGTAFAERLLEEKYVATVPAIGLGEMTDSFVRFSYPASDDDIREGMARVKEFCAELAAAKK